MATTGLRADLQAPQNHSSDQNPFAFLRLPQSLPPTRTTNNSIRRRKTLISCSRSDGDDPWEKEKVGFVDYDEGVHRLATQVTGLRRDDLTKRFRLRVDEDRMQRDWKVSEVVCQILKLNHWDDIDGALNRWAGRFARKNFPVLIREITKAGSLEHGVRVFN